MKKKRGKFSVLTRQKPRRGRKQPLRVRLKFWGLVALACLLVATSGYGFYRFKTRGVFVADASHPTDWRVSIKPGGDGPLSEAAIEQITQAAKHNAGDGSRQNLERAAEAIQQLDSYSSVSLIKLAPDHLAVHVKRRAPLFCVEADRMRFVTTDAVVFGTVDTSKVGSCPGPVLAGLFEDHGKFNAKADLTLIVDKEERLVLQEAVELLKAARERRLVLARMNYRRFRGFFVILDSKDTEVSMGRSPFAGKLDKLQGILSKLEAKGEVAQRIELDYQGKAFIKLKKM